MKKLPKHRSSQESLKLNEKYHLISLIFRKSTLLIGIVLWVG